MIRPMSPEPRMTASWPIRRFWRLTRFWAEPAVKIPAGRVPGISIISRVRSRQPMARTTAPASTSLYPSRELIRRTRSGRQVEDHGPGLDLDRLADDVLGEPLGVLGPADRLLIKEEPEAVVDALVEDAAEGPLALEEEDLPRARPPGAEGRGQPGRAAADDGDVAGLDLDPPSVSPSAFRRRGASRRPAW